MTKKKYVDAGLLLWIVLGLSASAAESSIRFISDGHPVWGAFDLVLIGALLLLALAELL